MEALTEREQMIVRSTWWMASHQPGRKRPRVTAATPFDDLPDLLSVTEFQTVTGLSRTPAYDIAQRLGVKVGGRRLVSKSVLKGLI